MNISLYFRSHYSKLWKRTFCRSQIKNVILKVYSYQSYYTLFLRNTETQQRISLLSHVQVIDLSLQLFSLLNKKEPQFYCEFLAFYESQYFLFCLKRAWVFFLLFYTHWRIYHFQGVSIRETKKWTTLWCIYVFHSSLVHTSYSGKRMNALQYLLTF